MRYAVLAGLAVFTLIAGCSDGSTGVGGNGVTRILLTDSPFPFDTVGSVDIHIVSVAVSRTTDTGTSADSQEWITVAEPRQRFDLLQLRDGATAVLGETELSAGEYKALRLVLDADRSRVTWANGDPAPVSWQGSGEMALHALVEGAIGVPEGGGRIVIDFDVGRSFATRTTLADGFVFLPWVRAVNQDATGTVAGTVYGLQYDFGAPVGGGSVAVFRGDTTMPPTTWSLAASAPVGPDGRYQVHFLAARTYIVQAFPPAGSGYGAAMAWPVVVRPGVTTTQDIMLAGNGGGGSAGYLRLVGDTSLAVGQQASFHAALFDAQGDSVATNDVTWSSSEPTVAAITLPPGLAKSQTVTVTGIANGTAMISAASGAFADAVWVTVGDTVPPGGPVATVDVTPASQTLTVGDSAYVRAILRDAQGRQLSGRTIVWAVSKPNVLRIDGQFGDYLLFRPIAADTVGVTATSEGKSGAATVAVRN